MIARFAWIAALMAGLWAASCNQPASRESPATREPEGETSMPSGRIEFVSVGRGDLAWNPREGYFGPQFVMIRSRAGWDRLAGHFQLAEASPDWRERLVQVDFSTQSVVALTLGRQGSTGHAVMLDRVEAGPPLRFVLTSTAPQGPAGSMMTHPFRLVILNLTAIPADASFVLDGAPVEFERHVME